MNSAAKFTQNIGTQKTVIPPILSQTIPTEPEMNERILTVDIKTMRTRLRDDSFNNIQTLLELFGKFSHWKIN